MVRFKQAIVVGTVALLLVSCSGGDDTDEQALTNTSEAATITTLSGSDSAGGLAAADQTTTTAPAATTTTSELSFPQYQIVSREATDSGDVVVVLLDKNSYESLSDIDIHNVISDLVEQYAPVYEAHIVESQAAADAVLVEDPTPEQQAELDANYIARLEEGFRIVYVGRFADSGVAILGS
jgi:hypothetical protein